MKYSAVEFAEGTMGSILCYKQYQNMAVWENGRKVFTSRTKDDALHYVESRGGRVKLVDTLDTTFEMKVVKSWRD
jgi:hypothetical protein